MGFRERDGFFFMKSLYSLVQLESSEGGQGAGPGWLSFLIETWSKVDLFGSRGFF